MEFSDLILGKQVYADKTDMVAQLASQRGAFFLSRPSGFGKSALLSAFKELFLHGKKNFAGLKLEINEPWVDEGSYKVLYLDTASCAGSALPFERSFGAVLAKAFAQYGILWGDGEDWVCDFEDALDQCDDRSIVLLMDDYDAPLIHALNDLEEFEYRREIMTCFFATLKKYSMKFRFAFVTGITEFAALNSFFGPNHFEDLTFDPAYGAIAGITQEELETCFKPCIARAAQILKEKYLNPGWDEEKVLKKLWSHYGGYSFESEAKIRVYNPRSLLRFFKCPQNGFLPYWQTTAGFSSSLLFHALDRFIKAGGPANKLCRYSASDYETTLSQRQLTASLDIEKIANHDSAFNAMLYQAGYLTIKDSDPRAFSLGFPNCEAKTAFADALMQKLTDEKSDPRSMNECPKTHPTLI